MKSLPNALMTKGPPDRLENGEGFEALLSNPRQALVDVISTLDGDVPDLVEQTGKIATAALTSQNPVNNSRVLSAREVGPSYREAGR